MHLIKLGWIAAVVYIGIMLVLTVILLTHDATRAFSWLLLALGWCQLGWVVLLVFATSRGADGGSYGAMPNFTDVDS